MASKTAAQQIREAFARAQRRTALVHWLGFTGDGAGSYSVDSSVDPTVGYRVMVLNGTFTCTCPSAERASCWHRAAAATIRANRQAFGLAPDGPAAWQAQPVAVGSTPVDRRAAAARLEAIANLFAA